MYTALNIAKYIINKCIEIGRPISNLQLQKILYYVQGAYIENTNGDLLFGDDIEAWQYGPVIPSVYYEFNIYSSSNISNKQEDIDVEERIKEIIDPIIKDKSSLDAWTLVNNTHNEEPWKTTYQFNKRNIINQECLKNYFMRTRR